MVEEVLHKLLGLQKLNLPAVLSNWVRHYFFIEQKGGAHNHLPFKLMADGFSNLIFQYNSAFQDSKNNNFYPSIIFACISNWVVDGFGFQVFLPLIFLGILIVSYVYFQKNIIKQLIMAKFQTTILTAGKTATGIRVSGEYC